MVANEDSVQLSDYCFDVCEVLKAAIQGRSTGSLSEATKTALEDLGRYAIYPLLVRVPLQWRLQDYVEDRTGSRWQG